MGDEIIKNQDKVFITEYEQEDEKYAGPYIKAQTWEEARAKAEKALVVTGELATS